MQGMELVGEKKKPDVESTKRVMELTKKNGLLVGKGGTYGNVLRVAPPLNVDKDEIDQALKVLDQSFGQLGQLKSVAWYSRRRRSAMIPLNSFVKPQSL